MHKQQPIAKYISSQTIIRLLVWLVGIISIVYAVSRLKARYLSFIFAWRYITHYGLTSPFETILIVFTFVMPLILILAGLALIFRPKRRTSIVLCVTYGLAFILNASALLLSGFSLRAITEYQQIVLLVLAAASACLGWFNPPSSLIYGPDHPAFKLRKNLLYLLLGLLVVSPFALWLGKIGVTEYDKRLDNKTASEVKSVVTTANNAFNNTKDTPAVKPLENNTRLVDYTKIDSHTYRVCASFHLSTRDLKSTPHKVYAQDDISTHYSGKQCYEVNTTKNLPIIKDVRIDQNILVTSRKPAWTINGRSLLDGNDVQINFEDSPHFYDQNGKEIDADQIKIGNIIDAHWENNQPQRKVTLYKVVVTQSGQDPRYCEMVTESNSISPYCPETTTNLTLTELSLVDVTQQSLTARTATGRNVTTGWEAGTVTAKDAKGTTISLDQLKAGENINLVFSGYDNEDLSQIIAR